ncbi:AfsR/SARP family transcriptional regulator [Kitasatospora sp. NPDC097643]|uniref:AfsR/SARP family transcriptional regulator n=1 Tax=Kitasatospora sp. NPDC097643 TaxID=3157230 RepID=UPI00331ADA43
MEFQVLGPIEIRTHDGAQVSPKALKVRSLLAYLCAHSGRTVPSSRLVEALWSGMPPQTASTALHVYVSKLRKYLHDLGLPASTLITTHPPGYRLNLADCSLDLDRFEGLLRDAQDLHSRGHVQEASRSVSAAIALWRGRAFEDLRTIPAFNSLGRRLDERLIYAYEQRFELELALGNHRTLISEIHSLMDELPTWENLYGYLIMVLYRSGRTAEALSAYSRIRRTMVQELGIEPSPRLQQLQRAVLQHDPVLNDPGFVLARPLAS